MQQRTRLGKLSSDYGILLALGLLCAYFSWATLETQHPTGRAGAEAFQVEIRRAAPPTARGLIVARDDDQDREFAETLERWLRGDGYTYVSVLVGQPADARKALEQAASSGQKLDFIACSRAAAGWAVFDGLSTRYPSLTGVRTMTPGGYRWPNFLKSDNLLNVANQIAVIAIIAIGMTMVILTGGIDLSVGSLIALSAVVSTMLIRGAAGGENATAGGMTLSCLGGIGVCGLIGLFTGAMVTLFRIPSFIVTLAMMLVASGLAFLFAKGQSIYQVPDSFIWLGRGEALVVPNAVILMLALYAGAAVLLGRTALGRHIYATGSNQQAARLAGVPVQRVLLFVYTISAALAGLGGVVMASQLKSGSPTYGQMYELYVIAAVVVGGASLAGGRGNVLGTLLGALLIAVIQNGMNLTGVESYTQKVVLGLVILGAVVLDMVRRRRVQC